MSLWQKREWSEMLKNSGQADEIFEVDGIFIEKRKISFGKYGLFVIGLEKSISPKTAQKLENLCKKEKALFLQIETIFYDEKNLQENVIPTEGEIYKKNSPRHPELVSGSSKKENTIYDFPITGQANSEGQKLGTFQETVISSEVEKSFPHNLKGKNWKTGYYKKFIPPFTAVINLKKSEEEILASMKPKGRYNIKLAEKKGVICKIVEKSKENISLFFSMMQETCTRDDFAGNTFEYYEYFLKNIDGAELFIAYFEETPIASGIFIFKDEVSFYYYGASTSNFRNLMAPYLLQWTAIQEAKKRGSKIYDFLGIASPGEKNSPLAGVTEFKTKLSQDTRKVSEGFIFVENKIMYFLIMGLRKIKN